MNRTGSRALPGFLVIGYLFALLGALLPAWGHHLSERDSVAGAYFLCLGAGFLAATQILPRFVALQTITRSLISACGLACVALAGLSAASPPVHAAWRLIGWVAIGVAAGVLNSGLFAAIQPIYRKDPASTLTAAGIYFGLGCLVSALLVAGTFYLYSVSTILLLSALLPGSFAVLCWRRASEYSAPRPEHLPSTPVADFLTPGAAMFALLLFFQSGNEWAVAGWLPVFLIRRLGISPETGIWMLAIYWFALLGGRLAAIYLAPAVRHGRLLFGSAAAALTGCLLLVLTNNRLGATTGILFAGGGFAAVFPLVLEKIGRRFPSYHPGVFNSVFSIALATGMLAPWVVGLLADSLGLWVVMGLPAAGTLMVLVLLLLLWLESKVTGR